MDEASARPLNEIQPASTVDPHPQVVARRLAERIVLVNLNTNRIFTLNRTGSSVWELLAAGRTEADIVATLSDLFAVDPCEAALEVTALVEQLLGEGLVVRSSRQG